jgi:hypothetical protein
MIDKKNAPTTNTDKVVYVDSYHTPEIYADGLSGILVGFPTLKMSFHTVLSSGEAEVRRNCAVITMDMHSALDMAFDILESCKENEEQLLYMASKGIPTKLKEFLSRIPTEDVSPDVKQASKSRASVRKKS